MHPVALEAVIALEGGVAQMEVCLEEVGWSGAPGGGGEGGGAGGGERRRRRWWRCRWRGRGWR